VEIKTCEFNRSGENRRGTMKTLPLFGGCAWKRRRPARVLVSALALVLCMCSYSDSQEPSKAVKRKAGESTHVGSQTGAGDLYVLAVGISKYRHPQIRQLSLSARDAQDFADFFETHGEPFRNVHITALLNEEATHEEVEKNLYYKMRRAGKDDTVVLFFSGHGADDPHMPGEFFFLTYDADPEFLEATSVNMSRMRFLKRLDCKRVLVVADACHAGGFSASGIKTPEPPLKEFMRRFRESEGRVILTSCRPDEVSMEKPQFKNSVFTHYLLDGLKGRADGDKNSVVTLKEVYDYVYEKTKHETRGVQHPQWEGKLVGAFPMSVAKLRPSEPLRSDVRKPPARRAVKPSRQTPSGIEGLRQRAESGDAQAQFELGLKYEFALSGAPKDEAEARKWYYKASQQGHQDAKEKLAGLSPSTPPSTHTAPSEDYASKAKRLVELWEKGDAAKSLVAERELESMYRKPDPVKWFRRAAQEGNALAQFNLGRMYEKGLGVGKDYLKAVRLYRTAAEKGNASAQASLGDMYRKGHGVSQNLSTAMKWYQRASDKGVPRGSAGLGDLYASGSIQYTDPSLDFYWAMDWYRKAAEQRHGK